MLFTDTIGVRFSLVCASEIKKIDSLLHYAIGLHQLDAKKVVVGAVLVNDMQASHPTLSLRPFTYYNFFEYFLIVSVIGTVPLPSKLAKTKKYAQRCET